MKRIIVLSRLTVFASLLSLLTALMSVSACPFCLAPPQTFSERFLLADVVVVAELVKFEVLNEGTVPKSTLRIRQLLRGNARSAAVCGVRWGHVTILNAEAAGKPGDLFLLFGDLPDFDAAESERVASTDSEPSVRPVFSSAESGTNSLRLLEKVSYELPRMVTWADFDAISPACHRYLQQIPSRDLPVARRLSRFYEFLESSDPSISEDAWAEYGGAAYEDVVAVKHLFQPERLRSWIADPQMSPERLGLYGLMLGLSGDAADAEFLRLHQRVAETGEFRFGGEGLMAGYLLLTGESGLAALETEVIDPEATDSFRHAFVQALQFFWSYEKGILSEERVCSSMRLMLKTESVRDIAIINLARWEDWDCLPQLMQMFETDCASDEASQKVILQFAQTCRKASLKKDPSGETACVATEFVSRVSQQHGHLLRTTNREFRAPQ